VPGAIRASRVARDAGVPVVADLERADSPRFEELLALVNHLVVSETFARRITWCASPESAIRALWSKGRSVVILTCGATGCWYAESPPSPHFFPAFRVEARDTAGCGDVFHGAYVSSLARGRTLIERVKFASAAAALYASASGEDRIPRRTEVNHFQKAFESKSLLAAKSS
jgi:sugar/nucleoside kinase (ribokinase family)